MSYESYESCHVSRLLVVSRKCKSSVSVCLIASLVAFSPTMVCFAFNNLTLHAIVDVSKYVYNTQHNDNVMYVDSDCQGLWAEY